ncbi:GH1 family beta-glucosidase [Cytobacillus sp. IB215316]|uniref:GH1 family beta-glucosidase n=1 Tax=Cytobacillus sp. IB215316 TaxID=3097354 RepID=UPI002A135B3B|nr:GH1 family beta-glucosidase [Cytobacillus sp. IB215316]MDX8361315.1 GH1 family beta-glucosidase [Cytobacillus sp. IB215316]
MLAQKSFPKGFVWGTATSSYQIEGAIEKDGRSESIWDTFCRVPGKVVNGDNGDIACDHYHKIEEDVKLLADLGIKHYRFSVAWPRIFPQKSVVNQAGLDFYKRLLAELKKYDIKPALTIYHWDLPQWIQDEGGWVNRNIVDYYMEYATTLFNEFGNEVPMWFTHNEPWCAAFLGYGEGVHAPGHQNWREAIIASHHIFLSHGLAVQKYKEMNLPGEIGIVLNLQPAYPATNSEEDIAATKRQDGYSNRWFLDPIFYGKYPTDMLEWFKNEVGEYDFIKENDLATINNPGDFLAVNFYSRSVVAAGEENQLLKLNHIPQEGEHTDMGWEVHPESLYVLLKRLQSEYTELPIYIAENGAAMKDELVAGVVDDKDRIAYVQSHLEACHRFIEEGGNLKGYYLWSFMDNFEWAFGYEKRFGMVYVDYKTQQRIPKESAKWFTNVMKENAIVQPVLK